MRPPVPITVAGGRALPEESTVTVALAISVVVRLGPLRSVGRNSLTLPLTVTLSPTRTVGRELVKTKMPSDVAGSASGVGPGRKKPLDRLAVTMPGTPATSVSRSGLMWPPPWISRISRSVSTLADVIDAVPSAAAGRGTTAMRRARLDATKTASAAAPALNRVRNIGHSRPRRVGSADGDVSGQRSEHGRWRAQDATGWGRVGRANSALRYPPCAKPTGWSIGWPVWRIM